MPWEFKQYTKKHDCIHKHFPFNMYMQPNNKQKAQNTENTKMPLKVEISGKFVQNRKKN